MNPFVKIFIGTVGDPSGAKQVEDAIRKAETAGDEFLKTLKLGAGIDLGGRIVGSLAAVPGLFQSAVARGVEFNTSLGDAEVAIANVVKQFGHLSDAAAKEQAAAAIAKIVEIEPKAAGSLRDLTGGVLATLASAQAAGISIGQNVELVGKFANALANANIPAEQLSQELRAIFTGNITPDASLAKILNISSEDVNRAKDTGKLYEFLTEKVGSLGEAGDTFGVKMSSLSSAVDKALGAIAEGTTEVFSGLATALTQDLANPEVIASFRALGVEIGHLVQDGAKLLEWAVKNADTIADCARAVGMLGLAYVALKLKDLVIGFGLKTASLFKSTAAVEAETAAIQANTAAQGANRDAQGRYIARGTAGAPAAGGGSTALGVASSAASAGINTYVAWEIWKAKGESELRNGANTINAGAGDSLSRQDTMRAMIEYAGTAAAQGEAQKTLETAIRDLTTKIEAKTAIAEKARPGPLDRLMGMQQTREGAELENLQAELQTMTLLSQVFDKIAGKRALAVQNASALAMKAQEVLNLMQKDAAILEMRAAGYDAAADAAEREAAAVKLIAQLQKDTPGITEDAAREAIDRQVKARDAMAGRTAREALVESDETPQARVARLKGKFEQLTGGEAPGQFATGDDAAALAGNSAQALALAKQLLDAWHALTAEQAKQSDANYQLFQTDLQILKTYQDSKMELGEEVAIQEAMLTGDKERVRELEKQRTIRQETLRLEEAGFGKAEAAAAALRLSNARDAVDKKAREQDKGISRAQLAVDEAHATRGKKDDRAAEADLFKQQKAKEYRDQGFSDAEADSMAGRANDAREKVDKRARGTIGGHAGRSPLDRLGGGADNLAGLRTPLADQIAQGGAAGAAAGAADGKAAAKDTGAKEIKAAAAATTAAAAETKAAAGAITTAMEQLQQEMQTLKAQVSQLAAGENGR